MAIGINGREIPLNNEVLISRNGKGYAFPKKIEPFKTKTEISAERYALIYDGNFPDFSSRRAILMGQTNNGLKHKDAITSALKKGLIVPSPSVFMPHYMAAIDASNQSGVLYDAFGNLIEGERLRKYAAALSSDYWVNLNAKFVEGSGFLGLDIETITGLNQNGSPIFSREPLEDCLENNGMVDLESLNSQGFPTRKSDLDYTPSKVIRFYRPTEGSVARFIADSDWANFNCGRDPRNSDPALGVPVCAEGA